ncbi:hypothetical protein FOL47_000343 [Perkinsus chesapeaki]|uniref:Uncharacterized protein n=1 Tax=Perkinsus chesapeaki TaxID=330153 RepID=A0A7J6MLZ2_PERCH|nr:hypothetical protein FOL47_000343 [Perkinsus chesapeaki]
MPVYSSHPIDEFLPPSQSSNGTTGGSASDAEKDISYYHKSTAKPSKRRSSARLKPSTPTEKDLEHVHNYNTRLKPNTPAQKRAFNRKDKPKPKVKRQRSVLMPRKNSRPPSKAEQCLRLQKKQVREQGFETLWETLKASNPLESMSLIMKKRLAVHITLTQLYGYSGWACRKDIEEFVADMLEVSPPSVAKWCREFELNLSLEEDRRGKHPKVRSPIFDTEFQPFRDRLRDQVLGPAGKEEESRRSITGGK